MFNVCVVNISVLLADCFVIKTCPIHTRRRFDVHKTSITLKQRRADIKTTSCAYWVVLNHYGIKLVSIALYSAALYKSRSELVSQHHSKTTAHCDDVLTFIKTGNTFSLKLVSDKRD